jgi:hypothetical protein
MPYASNKQAAFMHIHHPDIASKWHEEGHGYVKGGKHDPGRKKKGKLRAHVEKSKKDWAIGLGTATVGGALANQVPPVRPKRKKKAKVEKTLHSGVLQYRMLKPKKKGQIKKMLVPISTDPDFNQEAAQKAFDLVMKMDDDTAEMFCHIVVSDYFEETVEKNLVTLQRHLDETLASQLEELKKAHLRIVAKGMDSAEAVAYAQAIALFENQISKAKRPKTPQEQGYVWRERDFNRDPSSGQFRTKISHNQTRELKDDVFQSLTGANTPTEHNGNKLSEEDRIRFQDEYRQLAGFLQTVQQSTGGAGNQSVMLHYRDRNGESFSQVHQGTRPPTEQLADPSFRLMGVEARPTTLTAGGAAFGLATSLGGGMNADQVGAVNAAGQHGGTFAEKWTGAGDQKNSNAKLYGRLAASGDFLQATGLGPKAQMAGKFASIVGNAGPEAERVLGPTTRKTAYRYRGTEKMPEKKMVSAYAQKVEQGKVYGEVPEEGEAPGRRQPPGHAPSLNQMVAQRAQAAGRAPTWKERELGRQALVDHLRSKMPNKSLYELQLASGNTPPSEGVIINADGQLVTQAVGYGDDHYLPFNLKNLKGLKGGEYIRTRSVGGLTSEDIYTALIAGARQVTVTSRSGTYTMTFEPDFRGGRRHNDKARRMTRRYEQLLDAVQSQQVERIDIDPDMRAEIEREVKEEMAGPQWRNADRQEAIRERIEEFKENPYITEEDEKRAEVIINSRAAGASEGERNKIRAQVMDDLMDQKETKFRLNSAGYKAALDGLQEQFPYYISKPRWTPPKDEEARLNTSIDRGYVEPGRNRPTAAAAGLFGVASAGKYAGKGGKFSAREADYQGARGKLKAVEEPTEGSEGPKGESKGKNERRKLIAESKLDEQYTAAALELQRHAKSPAGLKEEELERPDIAEVLAMNAEDLKDPARRRKFTDWAEAYTGLAGFKDLALKRKWEAAAGHRDRKPFVKGSTLYPKQPATFEGEEAYELGADPKLAARELMRVDRRAKGSVVNAKLSYSQLSEAEMEQEHRALKRMHEALAADPTRLTIADLAEIGVQHGSPALTAGKRDLRANPDDVLEQMELLQRSRSLLSGMNDEQRKEIVEQSSKVVETHKTPTSEEQAQPKEKVATQIAWGKRVLSELEGLRTQINQKLKEPGVKSTHRDALNRALEKLPDEQTTERAQNAVAMWEANQDTLRTNEDFAALTDSMIEERDALMEASAILSQQRENVGILLNPPKRGG